MAFFSKWNLFIFPLLILLSYQHFQKMLTSLWSFGPQRNSQWELQSTTVGAGSHFSSPEPVTHMRREQVPSSQAGLITPDAPPWSWRPFVIFVQECEDTCSEPRGEINRTRFVRFLDHQPASGQGRPEPRWFRTMYKLRNPQPTWIF